MSIYNFYITPEEYELAEQNGISKWTLDVRIKDLLWDKETAITKPVAKRDYSNKEWADLAEKNGINRNTFYSRLRRGMNPKDAATTESGCKKLWHKRMEERRKRNYRYPAFVYDEIKKIGITPSTFHYRVTSGNFTFEEAYTIPPLTPAACARRAHQSRRGEEINAV